MRMISTLMMVTIVGALGSQDRDVPRYTEILSKFPVQVQAGRTLDWVPEVPFGVRCTAGYPGLRIECA